MKKLLSLLFLLCLTLGTNAQVANQPADLLVCDDDGDGIAVFDLTFTEAEILETQDPSDFIITFYITQLDADNSINPIFSPSAYTNFINPQTIYARLEALSNGSFDTTNFALLVLAAPSPDTPTPLEVCDDNGDGIAEFVLTDKDDEIINGDPSVFVLYYETFIDAQAGVPGTDIQSPYTNIIPFNQVVYARVTKNIPPAILACYNIVELELWVLDGCPIIATDPTDLFINEGDNDGSAIFDLTVNEPQMLGSQDPNLYRFSYHETFEDSEENVNEIISKTVYQNIANPQMIFVRLTNNVNGSYALIDFEIETDGVLGINSNVFSDLSIFPIPASERISIQSQYLTSEIDITIYTIHGQQVFSGKKTPENGKLDIDISEISSGIYLLKIVSEGNTITKKLLKM